MIVSLKDFLTYLTNVRRDDYKTPSWETNHNVAITIPGKKKKKLTKEIYFCIMQNAFSLGLLQ